MDFQHWWATQVVEHRVTAGDSQEHAAKRAWAAATKAEREACAKIVEEAQPVEYYSHRSDTTEEDAGATLEAAARAIRAR
jgi:hypothetical protein